MKNFVGIILFLMLVQLSACGDEKQLITLEQLPPQARTLVQQTFPNESISHITKERDFLSVEYEVLFTNGAKVEFDGKGLLKHVDCKYAQVPNALIPKQVQMYISEQFPNTIIVEWGKDDNRWKAELNSELELIFDSDFRYIGIDD